MRRSRGGVREVQIPPPWKIQISLNLHLFIKWPKICPDPPPLWQTQITPSDPPPPRKIFWLCSWFAIHIMNLFASIYTTLCPKISSDQILLIYLMFINASGLKWCSFNSYKYEKIPRFLIWNTPLKCNFSIHS